MQFDVSTALPRLPMEIWEELAGAPPSASGEEGGGGLLPTLFPNLEVRLCWVYLKPG